MNQRFPLGNIAKDLSQRRPPPLVRPNDDRIITFSATAILFRKTGK